ncbi:MAG TPA: hypothetical protein VKR56_06775 [Candidatus Cybelea sp.]|nr:hypothetical protein [Candidatus Cybelea sp.]
MDGRSAVLLLAALGAGCSGGATHSVVPPASSAQTFAIRGGTVSLPACNTQRYGAPGKFTVFTALGTFTGASFAGSGLSLWATVSIGKGRKNIPIIHLPNVKAPYTVYYGTYKLNDGLVGCFYLAKIRETGISFDGAAAAVPNVHDYGNATPAAEGPLVISVSGIAAKGGSGTITLKAASGGKVAYTGTVHISGSKYVP